MPDESLEPAVPAGPPDTTGTERSVPWKKLAVLGAVVVLVIIGYTQFGDALTLESIAKQEGALRDYKAAQPALVFAVAFVLYVLVTGLSLPGATVLTLAYGWYFDVVAGFVLVSFASTAGATLAFLLSRYILRDSIQNKFGDRLETFNRSLKRDGAFYLFTLRLIPVFPFFVINVVMGLTPLKVWTFWWVSQVGMLAGTLVYVYAGSTVPELQVLSEEGAASILSPQLIVAFVVLGLFPLIVKLIMNKVVKRKETDPA